MELTVVCKSNYKYTSLVPSNFDTLKVWENIINNGGYFITTDSIIPKENILFVYLEPSTTDEFLDRVIRGWELVEMLDLDDYEDEDFLGDEGDRDDE